MPRTYLLAIPLLFGFVSISLAQSKPAPPARPGAFLGDLTWTEAEERLKSAPLVILPFGAGAKEHGPHLPMNADFKVLEYLCERAVEALPVIVAPPVQHGWFPAFREFPGTEISDPEVFQEYVAEVARSLVRHGAKRIVILNTGVAAATGLPLSIVAREIRAEGTPALVISWNQLETEEYRGLLEQKIDSHGGESETSINLFLQPHLVRMDRAVRDLRRGGPRPYPGYEPGGYSRNPGDPDYSKTGITGDPTKATAEKGKKWLDLMAAQLLKSLRGFAEAPLVVKDAP